MQTKRLTVAGRVLLASNESLGVEKTPVGTRPYFIDDIGLEINVKRAWHVLARRCLREESAEAIVVRRGRALNKTAVGLQPILNTKNGRKRVTTYAKTVFNGVELP